jgi:hypothetical protein
MVGAMALYEIQRICGHTEEVQIYGTDVRGQRKQRAAYLATLPCGDCKRVQQQTQRDELAARATAVAAGQGWPALTGTERQVPWAQDIRATILARLAEQITDEATLAVYATAALRQTAAGWWIDRRGLATPVRNLLDAVAEPGAARANHGSLPEAVEATMTDAELATLADAAMPPVQAGGQDAQ